MAAFLVAAAASPQPNIFVLLTDDQDDLLNSTIVQPNLLSRVGGQGVRFANGFVNHPVCCVSRSSLLTGRYSHNTHVLNNSAATGDQPRGNCTSPAWAANLEPHALAVHLHSAGYHSIYMGKYMNDMHNSGSVPPEYEDDPFRYIPPGWSEWYGLQGNSKYYNYSVSNNGTREDHGDDYDADYFTLQLERRARRFLAERAAANRVAYTPFFLMMGTPAAHADFIPPPGLWPSDGLPARGVPADATAPRTPNHNAVCEHCHLPLRHYPKMSDAAVAESDEIWRRRLGTLAFVDDMLGCLMDQLEASAELERTLILYTADNGFHMGQWAQGFDKRQMYETDLRVPYFVRCPGCVRGATLDAPISHVDIMPTLLDFAGVALPRYLDGRSFRPLLEPGTSSAAQATWDPRVFVQYYGESYVAGTDPPDRDFKGGCGCGIDGDHSAPGSPYPGEVLSPDAFNGAPCDGWNNTYACSRKVATAASPGAYIYCAFECFAPNSMAPMACDAAHAEGTGEYYDMEADPWQMTNLAAKGVPAPIKAHVDAMKACAGEGAPEEGGCRLPPLRVTAD